MTNSDGAHARVGHARQLGHGADQHGAHEGSALSADVVDAEVFPGLLRRNDAGEVGAGERLDRALEHAHHHGEEPELPLPVELDGEQRDGRVGRDADLDQARSLKPLGKLAEQQRAGKGDDLRQRSPSR